MLIASTADHAAASGPRVGRKMEYPEKREAAFAKGTLARIKASLKPGETLVGFIREAVAEKLEREKRD